MNQMSQPLHDGTVSPRWKPSKGGKHLKFLSEADLIRTYHSLQYTMSWKKGHHKSQFVILGCFTHNSLTWFSLFCQIGNITALNSHTVY